MMEVLKINSRSHADLVIKSEGTARSGAHEGDLAHEGNY